MLIIMSTLRGLDQNFECAEKHLEFAIENNHEILEKLDYLEDDDKKAEFLELITKVNQALRQVYSTILEFKVQIKGLLLSEEKDAQKIKETLHYIKRNVSILRRKLRISRKAYQQLKEYCLEKKLTSDEESKIFWDAMLGEIADGRGNIYAAEKHLTEIVLDVEKRLKGLEGGKNNEK